MSHVWLLIGAKPKTAHAFVGAVAGVRSDGWLVSACQRIREPPGEVPRAAEKTWQCEMCRRLIAKQSAPPPLVVGDVHPAAHAVLEFIWHHGPVTTVDIGRYVQGAQIVRSRTNARGASRVVLRGLERKSLVRHLSGDRWEITPLGREFLAVKQSA